MSGIPSSMFWSGLLWTVADFLAQKLESRGKPYPPAYDYKRTLRLAVYAVFIFAPMTVTWFEFLENTFPGTGTVVALKRMALDQTLNAVVSSVTLFVAIGLMEGKSVAEIRRKLDADLWATLKAGWVVWPAVQFCNMAFVPLHQRLLVANIVNVPWCMYLSLKVASSAAAGAPNAASGTGAGAGAINGAGNGSGKDKEDPPRADAVGVDIGPDHGGAGGGVASTQPLTRDA